MRKDLLELLACPMCSSSFELHATVVEQERVRSGTVNCGNKHAYPIRDYIPRFTQQRDYMEVFSFLRHSAPSIASAPGEVDTLTRDELLGQTLTDPESLRGATVLDAGCGDGRFMRLLAGHGVRVVGMDMDSTGLQLANNDLGLSPNAHLVQADLFQLPFRPRAFDFIYSLGVLHHTPDPKKAFLNLTRLLHTGGKIAVWMYPKSERTPLSDALRPLTTRIPETFLYWIGLAVTSAYAPLLRIPTVKPRLQAMLYSARLPWHEESDWRIQSFMDWYGPKYQFKYSPEEVEAWFREAGLIHVIRCPYQTSAQGSVPVTESAADAPGSAHA